MSEKWERSTDGEQILGMIYHLDYLWLVASFKIKYDIHKKHKCSVKPKMLIKLPLHLTDKINMYRHDVSLYIKSACLGG